MQREAEVPTEVVVPATPSYPDYHFSISSDGECTHQNNWPDISTEGVEIDETLLRAEVSHRTLI